MLFNRPKLSSKSNRRIDIIKNELVHSNIDAFQEHDSFRLLLRLFFLGSVLVLLSDIPSSYGAWFYLAKALLVGALIVIVLVRADYGIILLTALAVSGRDIVSSYETELVSASIWQTNVGIIKPSWIFFVLLLVILLKSLRKNEGRLFVPRYLKLPIIWFLIVPLLMGGIYGGLMTQYATVEVVKDIKLPLMLFLTILVVSQVVKAYPKALYYVLYTLIGGLMARHFVDFIYLINDAGAKLAQDVTRVSEDSAKGGVNYLIFFGLLLFFLKRMKIIGATLAIIGVVLLVTYSTRFLWITFALGVMLLIYLLSWRKIFSLIIVGGLTIWGGVATLQYINPKTAELSSLRALMITSGRNYNKFAVGAEYNVISRIDPVRYGEILNIIDNVSSIDVALLGEGYGGYYSDSIVTFSVDLKSSFAEYSLINSQFFTAHGYIQYIFLKYGLIGLIIVTSIWVIPTLKFKRLLRYRKLLNPKKFHPLLIPLMGFIPFMATGMLQLYWSGKGLYINGVVMALLTMYTKMSNKENMMQ